MQDKMFSNICLSFIPFDKQICFEKHKMFSAKTNNSEAIRDDDLEEELTIPATTCWVKEDTMEDSNRSISADKRDLLLYKKN